MLMLVLYTVCEIMIIYTTVLTWESIVLVFHVWIKGIFGSTQVSLMLWHNVKNIYVYNGAIVLM